MFVCFPLSPWGFLTAGAQQSAAQNPLRLDARRAKLLWFKAPKFAIVDPNVSHFLYVCAFQLTLSTVWIPLIEFGVLKSLFVFTEDSHLSQSD